MQPGYAEKVLADTTGAAAEAAASAIEKTSVVLGHSILDEVISECCRISAQLMPDKWMAFVTDRKVPLSEVLASPAPDISQKLLSDFLEQLSRESLRRRMDTLNERYQPAPAFEYEGAPYKFDRDRIVAIDLHRQRIIHQLELSRNTGANEAADLLYLEATCFFFIYVVAHKHGVSLDPARDALDVLRSRESSPVKLAYEGLLLATSLPVADEQVWSSGGQIFASGKRRYRQLPIFLPAAMPDLSADHARITFVKHRKRSGEVSPDGYVEGRSPYIGDIFTSAVDGSGMELVLEGGPHPGLVPPISRFPEELEGITNPKFDPEARRIFFIASAWTTSGAIYVLDLKTREVTFFTDGNGFVVLHGEPHRGSLLVSKHRYHDAPNHGSYDHLWLVSAEGQVGGDHGSDLDAALTKLYGDDGRKLAFPHLV